MMQGLIGAVLLSGVMCAGGTKLSHEGRVLFEAAAEVSYGATYAERCVKAVVTGKEPTQVKIYTGKAPKYLFVNSEPLPAGQWSFDAKTGLTALSLPAGSVKVQARFDDMASIRPFAVTVPVMLSDAAGNKAEKIGELNGNCEDEQCELNMTWTGESGIYTMVVKGGDGSLKPSGGLELALENIDGTALYLTAQSALRLPMTAPGGVVPQNLSLQVRKYGGAAPVKAIDRAALLARKDVFKVEGEDFVAESVGQVSKSTTHANTSGGGCIFNWGTKGSRLDWELTVPQAGEYELVFVLALADPVSLRSLQINGVLAERLGLLEFPTTGGWGRGPASEWQAWVPQDGKANARVKLKAGKNVISLTNILGQHLNVDCIVAVPVK